MYKVLTGVVFPWRKCVIGAWYSFVDVPQHEGEEAPELFWPESWSSPQHCLTAWLHTPRNHTHTSIKAIDIQKHTVRNN